MKSWYALNTLQPVHARHGEIVLYSPYSMRIGRPMFYIMDDFGNAYSPIWKEYA